MLHLVAVKGAFLAFVLLYQAGLTGTYTHLLKKEKE
jgi:hypothetical protein